MKYRDIPDIKLFDRSPRSMVFRNFAGVEKQYNPAGRRSFVLRFDPNNKDDAKLVEALKDDGWNIREHENKDGDLVPQLQVFVDFSKPQYMPRIKMLRDTDYKGISINADNASELDGAEIVKFDVRIRPYQWETAVSSGVKAMVKSMNVIVEHDDVADRYSDYQDTEEDEELPFL